MDGQQAFKVVLCGNASVGKTSIVQRYCYGSFDSHISPTMGADFVAHTVVLPEGEVKFHIWDTAGQEQYQAIGTLFFRSSALAFVVYDVTTESPVEEVRKWIDRMHTTEKNAEIVVLGNKIDLVGEVKDGVIQWCQEHNIKHFFCSALSGIGVEEGFLYAAKFLRGKWPAAPATIIISEQPSQSCC
jgi:small GTP-binding protein